MGVQEIFNAVINMDDKNVAGLVREALDQGTEVGKILNEGLIAALDEVGRRFSTGEMFLPEMLKASQVMKLGLEIIRPLLGDADTKAAGTVVLGTVKGDLHDIGKNLVGMMLEGAGYNVIDLGVDVEANAFVQQARETGADVVALSALLTTTIPAMEETVSVLREAGITCKIIVGGAPVSQGFADEIGADAYGDDAPMAVTIVRSLLTA